MTRKNIFERLAHHLNQHTTTAFPETKEFFEILELLFTPEQAECAIHLPITNMGRITLEDLAQKMNKQIQELGERIETMAKAGTVMATTSRKDGRKYYALWPLVPGMLESTYADGIDNEQRRKLSELWRKYLDQAFLNEQASSSYPLYRIIPINDHIDPASQVLPFEEARNMILQAEVMTVIPCHCRSVMKKCNHILNADFVFGAWADYLINYRGARRWTREEAIQRLKECEQDGLVHLTGNAQQGSSVICNCCPCCCGVLRAITELNIPRSVARTNFSPRVDQQECTLCMKCVETCPTDAITELPPGKTNTSNTKLVVQESQCIGCGLCAQHCPLAIIRMVKVRDDLPAPTVPEMVKRYQEQKRSG